jgi:plastocyanin
LSLATWIRWVPHAVATSASASAAAEVMISFIGGGIIRKYDRPMTWRRWALTLLVLGAGTVAGCGRSAVVGATRVLNLSLTEYRLTPDNARVSAGVLTIVLHNYGKLTHNLTISSNGETEASTKPVWPGQTASLTLSLAPGRYQLASTLLSDEALGAYGTLTVH